jgi:hypothetical protein
LDALGTVPSARVPLADALLLQMKQNVLHGETQMR